MLQKRRIHNSTVLLLTVWFDIQLNALQVILGEPSQPISWLVLINKIKQRPNYNTNNLNDTYK